MGIICAEDTKCGNSSLKQLYPKLELVCVPENPTKKFINWFWQVPLHFLPILFALYSVLFAVILGREEREGVRVVNERGNEVEGDGQGLYGGTEGRPHDE